MVAGDQPLTEYTPSWHQKCRTLTKLAMPYYQRYHIFFVLKLLATSLQTKDYDLLLQSKRLSTYHPHRQNKNIPSSKTLFVYTICNNWSGFLKRLSVFFLDSRMKLPHWTAKNAKKLRKGHATKVPRKARYLRLKHVSCLYFLWEITTFIFNKSSKLVLRGFNRRWRSKNCDSIVVTRAKAALHVLETSFQAVCSDRVRMMRLDEALQPWDDFVVWDR